jgi:hypothetical protein
MFNAQAKNDEKRLLYYYNVDALWAYKVFTKYVAFICAISVSLQPKVVYKPTEYPYSKCLEHGTDRVTCEELNFSKGMYRFLFLFLRDFHRNTRF